MRSRTLWTSSRPARKSAHSLALLPRQAQSFLPKSGAIPTTTSTMRFKFGDVVLVPFPFTNQAASKKRWSSARTPIIWSKPMSSLWRSLHKPARFRRLMKSTFKVGKLPDFSNHPLLSRSLPQSSNLLSFVNLARLMQPTRKRCDMRLRALSDDDHITTKHTGRMNYEFNGLSRCSVRSCN
jgi:hypothetical protein